MLTKRLKELLDFVRATDLQEVVWEKDGAQIRFSRAPAAPSRSAPSGSPIDGAFETPPAQEALTIRSTMVGTFSRSDSTNRPPLVLEGTLVRTGQIVATVEAMKIMKDVVSPYDCRILKTLVANGHPVEYGQALFEVELATENV